MKEFFRLLDHFRRVFFAGELTLGEIAEIAHGEIPDLISGCQDRLIQDRVIESFGHCMPAIYLDFDRYMIPPLKSISFIN